MFNQPCQYHISQEKNQVGTPELNLKGLLFHTMCCYNYQSVQARYKHSRIFWPTTKRDWHPR